MYEPSDNDGFFWRTHWFRMSALTSSSVHDVAEYEFHNGFGDNLADDLHTEASPVRHSRRNHHRVSITSEDKALEAMIVAGISSDHHSNNIAEAFDSLLETCIHEIVYHGSFVAEIAYSNEQSASKPIPFRLRVFDPRTLHEEDGRYYQVLPLAVAEELGVARRVELPLASIMTIRLAAELEGQLRTVVQRLVPMGSDRKELWDFALRAITQGDVAGYDHQQHILTEDLAVAIATKEIGWEARRLFTDRITDYYRVHRMLRFREFAIQVRDDILAQLNQYLEVVGSTSGFSARIELQDVNNLDDIEQARHLLRQGKTPLTEIYKMVHRES